MSDDGIDPVRGGIQFVGNSVACLALITTALIHGRNLYLDVKTSERLSVVHRRRAPEKTPAYTLAGYATLMVSIFGIMNGITLTLNPLSHDLSFCLASQTLTTLFYICSKLCVYYVFTLRLHMVYQGSKYATRPGRLTCGAAFLTSVIIFVFIIYVAGVLDMKQNIDKEDDTVEGEDFFEGEWDATYDDGKKSTVFDNTCAVISPTYLAGVFGGFDIIVNLLYCVAFLLPIRDVIKNVQSSSLNLHEKGKLEKKMLFVGFKVFLLSVVLFISTLCVTAVFVVTNMLFVGVDSTVNFWCLALMTPYYPDNKYYRRYCRICICCCDCKGYTLKNNEDEAIGGVTGSGHAIGDKSPQSGNNLEETVFSSQNDASGDNAGRHDPSTSSYDPNSRASTKQSVDTMSAVRVTAGQEAPSTETTAKQKRELHGLKYNKLNNNNNKNNNNNNGNITNLEMGLANALDK